MHYVCAVQLESGYRLRLEFEDRSVKIVALAGHLDGEVFAPLKDVRLFRTVRLNADLDTVGWDNGADMSPDFLYEIGTPVDARSAADRVVADDRATYGEPGQAT